MEYICGLVYVSGRKIPGEPILLKIGDCIQAVENRGGQNAHNSLGMIKADLTELISLFKLFKSENKAINQGPSSSLSGLSTVPLLLLFYGFLR